MTAPRQYAQPIHWRMTFLESGTSVGDVLFSTNGAEDWVSLGCRTFAPGEPIDNFEFADGTSIANRHFHRYEYVEWMLGSEKRSYTFDLKQMVGWRWYGMRPYLRITDTISGRIRYFLCIPRGMFESQWAELSPTAHCPRWLAVCGQIEMIGYLFQDALLLAVLYWLPLYFAGPKLMPFIRELLGHFLLTSSVI